MAQLIDKDALVAEIDKRLHQLTDAAFDSMIGRNLIEIKDFLNTLEVKETEEKPVSKDLESEIQRYYVDWDEHPQYVQTARHFAKWQKEQCEKERLKHCDELTKEQAQIESDFVVNHLKKHNRTPTFIDAIEYGMRLQEKQMMAKAVDGVVTVDYYGYDHKTYGCIANSFCLEDLGLKDKDEVKVIVIKDE